MSVAFATRKLWLRRWHRVWNQLGWMLTYPFRHPGELVITILTILFAGSLVGAGYMSATEKDPASAEKIEKYSAKNECLRSWIANNLKAYKKPITNLELAQMQAGCTKQAEDEAALQEQMRMVK